MNHSGIAALLEKLKASPPDKTSLQELEFEPVAATASTPPPLPDAAAIEKSFAALRDDAKFWSELGTRLWRAERQMRRLHQSESSDGMERLSRRFDEILETLRDHDIEILDHTGEKYDAGLALKVLQYQPQDGIAEEVILETVKPSLRLQNILVPGEVIVATPTQE